MIDLPEPYRNAVTFAFGDTPKLADDLLALVLAGKKTATCGALRDFGPKGEPMPVVGRRDVVLDGAGRPAAVIETVEVVIRRFDAVGSAFALKKAKMTRHWKHGGLGTRLISLVTADLRPIWSLFARDFAS